MSESAPLLFKRKLGTLAPANRAAEEAVRALEDRTQVRVEIKATRGNWQRMKLYWACVNLAVENLDELVPGLTSKLLHQKLKRESGRARKVEFPSGDVEWDYDSISFDKMTENERAEYITWSLETLSRWLGCDVQDLRREGELEAAA